MWAKAGSPIQPQAQRGDGDPELAHGEVGVQPPGGILHQTRRRPPLLHEAVHLGGTDLDECELGGDEQAVQGDQEERQDDHEGVEN